MRHLILVIALLCFGSLAESAEITVNAPDAYHRVFVDIVGEITPNDDQTFEQKVATLQAHYQAQTPYLSQDPGINPSADPGLNPTGAIESLPTQCGNTEVASTCAKGRHKPVSDYDKVIVTLSGPGGVALAAMKIGELIHTNGWATYVPSETVCASSCAIIWLAGMPRTIEGAPGVTIGFHAVYDAQFLSPERSVTPICACASNCCFACSTFTCRMNFSNSFRPSGPTRSSSLSITCSGVSVRSNAASLSLSQHGQYDNDGFRIADTSLRTPKAATASAPIKDRCKSTS
jgi:hypothetical protein